MNKRLKDVLETLAYILLGYLIAVGANKGLGMAMNTSYPVVAVVSSSMEHDSRTTYVDWFVERNYSEEERAAWPFVNGINKGDIVFVKGTPFNETKVGDVIVYKISGHEPIIHRVVVRDPDGLITKGDNNQAPDQDTSMPFVTTNHLQGRAVFRVPLLGYVKILYMKITGRNV